MAKLFRYLHWHPRALYRKGTGGAMRRILPADEREGVHPLTHVT